MLKWDISCTMINYVILFSIKNLTLKLANRATEIILKNTTGENNEQSPTLTSNTETNSSPDIRNNRSRPRTNSKTYNFAVAVSDHMARHFDSNEMKKSDAVTGHILSSKKLKEYFYFTRSFLDDFDEKLIEERIEHLKKYSRWKVKKWAAHHKR